MVTFEPINLTQNSVMQRAAATLPATSNYPAYTSARQEIMYWDEHPSSPASSTAIPTQLFSTTSRTANSLVQHLQIPSRIAGTAADSSR